MIGALPPANTDSSEARLVFGRLLSSGQVIPVNSDGNCQVCAYSLAPLLITTGHG
jgi:hypothetical protein